MGAPVVPVLPEFCVVFSGDLADFCLRELLWRGVGRGAGFAEEAVEAGGSGDPEEEEFVVGIIEPVPGVFWDVDHCVLFKGLRDVVEDEGSAAFNDVEGLVHFEVTVDGDAGTGHHLLGSDGEVAGAGGGAELDVDVAAVAEVNEVFAIGDAEHVSLHGRGLGFEAALREHLIEAKGSNAGEEGSALLFKWIH